MSYNALLTASVQVAGDFICFFLSLICACKKQYYQKKFFFINCIAFFNLAIGDIYYNYLFRILHYDIKHSIGLIVTLTMLIFQLSQAYNWHSLIKKENTVILSLNNLPYVLFTVMVISVLIYYFITGQNPSFITIWYQSASVSLDMLVWLFAIICLARTRSPSIILLTFGCLMIISADLTTRCLFMLDMNKLATVGWIHISWVLGILAMSVGFTFCLQHPYFKFCHARSIQASCSSWMLVSSLAVFIIGFIFLLFFNLKYDAINIQLALWNLPIALMFTMITSVLLGNWFSNFILSPVNFFLKRIQHFNSGFPIEKKNILTTELYEFEILDDFINTSFYTLSTQLDREIEIAAQVAHDIRSPLTALEIVINRLPEVEESKRILLRDAVNHIRDITNNLEKPTSSSNNCEDKAIIQIAILLDYVLSERRIAFSHQPIEIIQQFEPSCYNFFIDAPPSKIKRVLTNIINNACEAVLSDGDTINIGITSQENNIIINITDNGPGIPTEILPSLFTRGFTTKIKGSGLGLYYARENLTKWGGSIDVCPNEKRGVTVYIKLPSQNPPLWFINNLSIPSSTPVICVDDSISILHAWQERFKSIDNEIYLQYCDSKEALLNEAQKHDNKICTYLIDYEFSGKSYTGLDLINIILSFKNPKNRIFLVTSRSAEPEIQSFCQSNDIYMIPKFFALKIPLQIINNNLQIVIITSSTDLPNIQKHTKYSKKILFYMTPDNFLIDSALFDRSTKIFINYQFTNHFRMTEIQAQHSEVIFFDDIHQIIKNLSIHGYSLGK